jgi:hypothetical protein
MNREELMEHLAKREVLQSYRDIRRDIDLLPPNVGKVHKRGNIVSFFVQWIDNYENVPEKLNRTETFAELSRLDSARYENAVDCILSAIDELGIKV